MKITKYSLMAAILGLLFSGFAFSQETGDYRSVATGNWSVAATWETFDGTNWVAAGTAPTGTENITVDNQDTVSVDVAVTISGYVTVSDTGVIEVTAGSLVFADGSTYEHARNEGRIPTATWNEGSTLLMTGITDSAPDNRNQNYYNITFNTPNMTSNRDMSLDDVTIGGDIRVINTGSARWRLTSASALDTSIVTIMGDVIVEDGSFETQGTGNALTTFIVHHYGNINVTGGTFGISRGSQGNGSGTTTWYLYEGNFSMSNAEIRNSNPTPANAKFVFAKGDTQKITFDNVEYGGGDIHYEVSDSTTLQITQDFVANGYFINHGTIDALGTLTFTEGGVYQHARDGGSVPTATWEEGSTAMFTGITTDAPDDRGQDYYNLTLDTPDLLSNRDMDLDGHTISGDITLLNSGSSRWRLVGGSSGTITIMGDVIVKDGSLETQGTSSATDVEVHHYGNVKVTGGTFAVSRGSQGGIGTTKWYLFEADTFSISNATTRNSNPDGATFIFAKEGGTQNIILSNVDFGSGGLPIQVDSSTTLNMDTTVVGGEGNFVLSAYATLASGNVDGIDGNLQTTGEVTFSKEANFMFNGTEAQVPGMLLPDTVGILTIANQEGVTFDDTLASSELVVSSGAIMQIDSLGNVTADSGSVSGTIINKGMLDSDNPLVFENGSVYEHARDGGKVPSAMWEEGSTALFTGITTDAPDNRGQDYYNLTLNTPGLLSNRDLDLVDNTIGGDITVINTGSSRWRLVGGDNATVTIMGNVNVQGGSFETQGTSSATVVEVHHYGDVVVTGGTFAVSRGSQGSGAGSTRWFMHEGNFSISNGETRNSNTANAWFVFDKAGTQNIELSNVDYGSGGLSIEVDSSATLDFGMSELSGNGLFMLDEDATLATANEGGLDSTIQTSGDITLNEGANFIFNGTAAQVTGMLMPMTVNNLTIDNDAGVELSQATTINGVLRLVAGVFNNTIPFTLGPNGSISIEGGSLLIPTAVEEISEVPTEFSLMQNYPNPFNPSTTIRFSIPKQSQVTLKIYDVMGREVAELVNEKFNLGTYEVEWNAEQYASGMYYMRIVAGDFVAMRKLILLK